MLFSVHLGIMLFALYVGGRSRGVGGGLAAITGLLLLALLGLPVGMPPFEIIEILLAVLLLLGTLEASGGTTYLTERVETWLRYFPTGLLFLGPLASLTLTLLTGTGYVALLLLPLLVQLAKLQGMPPVKVLVSSVIAAQLGIIASPVSAAMSILLDLLTPHYLSTQQVFGILIPSAFLGTCGTVLFVGIWYRLKPISITLSSPPIERLQPTANQKQVEELKSPKRAVLIATIGLLLTIYTVGHASHLGNGIPISRHHIVTMGLCTTATFLLYSCAIDPRSITQTKSFQQGISAFTNTFGIAWLGHSFVTGYAERVLGWLIPILSEHPALFPGILVLATTLFYSQAATAKVFFPIALQCHLDPLVIVTSFAATSALFILPTYPTLLAALESDDTGSTKLGKWWINHPFLLPGLVGILTTISIAYLLSHL